MMHLSQHGAVGVPGKQGDGFVKRWELFSREPEELDWQEGHASLRPARVWRTLRSFGLVVVIIVVATLISTGFRRLGYSEANYIMAYNLGVVLVAYFTDVSLLRARLVPVHAHLQLLLHGALLYASGL